MKSHSCSDEVIRVLVQKFTGTAQVPEELFPFDALGQVYTYVQVHHLLILVQSLHTLVNLVVTHSFLPHFSSSPSAQSCFLNNIILPQQLCLIPIFGQKI